MLQKIPTLAALAYIIRKGVISTIKLFVCSIVFSKVTFWRDLHIKLIKKNLEIIHFINLRFTRIVV